MSSALEAALSYLSRGWSVMAVPKGTMERRRPWRHLQRRLPTPEEVRRDFAQEPGTPNVAIITGRVSRLVIAEADTTEAAARLEALDLRTLTVKARRGPHKYLETDLEIPTRKLDGLELRGEGSYVLAPPSLHPSGLRYAFEDAGAPVAELPAEVLALFDQGRAGAATVQDLPERWLALVRTNPRSRSAWEGRGEHQDRSGSGKDFFLAHEARRCGFRPEEARQIVQAAPWAVQGGRTAAYLDRTIARAYQAGHKRQLPAYGQVPASIVDSGTWARLSPAACRLLVVLLVRRMRPSGKVIWSAKKLAKDAGIHPDTLGAAAGQLEREGLVHRKRVAGGRMEYHLPLVSPRDETGVREAPVVVGIREADLTPAPDRGKREAVTPTADRGKTSLVMNGKGARLRSPVPSVDSEGEGRKTGASAPSARLVHESLPDGRLRILQVRPEGKVVVFEGALTDWIASTWPASSAKGG